MSIDGVLAPKLPMSLNGVVAVSVLHALPKVDAGGLCTLYSTETKLCDLSHDTIEATRAQSLWAFLVVHDQGTLCLVNPINDAIFLLCAVALPECYYALDGIHN